MLNASDQCSDRQPDERTVVIVDDDAQVRKYIANVLNFVGFRAITVGNGTAASELIQAEGDSISLVISDICMPGGNGLDLGAELARTRPDLPLLYISGRVDSIAVEGIRLRYPRAILTKPISASTLIQRVKILVGVRSHAGRLGSLRMGPNRSNIPMSRRGEKLA